VVGRGATAGVRSRRPAGRATDREIAVVAAVLEAGSEMEAAHRLGLSHSTVKHYLSGARSKVGATNHGHSSCGSSPRRCGDPMATRLESCD
jgi:DNA-binding CsgD family transcriptional regulator